MGLLPPLVAELTAQNSEFLAKMAESKAAMDDVGESGGSTFSKLSAQGGVMAEALGGALVGVGAIALDLGMKYQTATAQLAASADISIAKANAIGNAFLTTGGSSVFSAQQMMEAYAPVAAQLGLLQGHALNASQALSLMKTASDLAEASGASLSSATSDLSAVLVAYGMNLNQANEASNILFNTSRLTGQSLDALTKVIQRMHSQLGDVTPSLAQVGGLMVDLTAHGESGRQALSGVNSAMSTLLGSFKNGQTTISPVTEELKTLGINVFDAQGKFVGLDSILGTLHDKFQGLSQEQQLAAASTLFGASSAEKMLGIVDAGPAVLDKYTSSVEKAGSAHDAAAKKSQTFEEQLKRLEVEAEDTGVRLGEWLIPKVELLTHDLLAGVEWLGHHKDALYALAALAGGYATIAIGAFAVNGVEKLGNDLKDGAQDIVNFGAKILGLNSPFVATQTEAEQTQGAVSTAAETMSTSMQEAATSMESAMTGLQAAIEENTAAIAASLGGIDTSMSGVAAGFSGDVATMESEYAGLRADLESPIAIPPVAGAGAAVGEAGAVGAEGAAAGEGAVAGAEGAAVGGEAALVAGGATFGTALAVAASPLLVGALVAGLAHHFDTSPPKPAGTPGPNNTVVPLPAGYNTSGAFGPGAGGRASGPPAAQNTAANAQFAQQYNVLQQIASLQAKNTDLKVLQQNVQNMSTLFGADSGKAANARAQLLAAEMKWAGVGAKDTTFSERLTALQTAENSNSAKASAAFDEKMALVSQDGTVKDLKTGITDEKTVLHGDINAGNTQGAANAQRQINTMEHQLTTIQGLNNKIATDKTTAKVDADLVAQTQSTHADLLSNQKKLDDVTVSKMPAMQAKGSMLARVLS